MTAYELANNINGREYGNELSQEECMCARENGLVVFLANELRGAINDSSDDMISFVRNDGFYISKYGFVDSRNENTHRIKVSFCDCDNTLFECKIDIPYETFTIQYKGDPYYRGFVFYVKDLE